MKLDNLIFEPKKFRLDMMYIASHELNHDISDCHYGLKCSKYMVCHCKLKHS